MVPTAPIVCVVEDDAAVRSALKFSLETEGLQVRVHAGASSLLDDPELPSCRCLIVDYRMPVVDGLELVEALGARGVTAPVIMITGRATRGLRARAAKLGVHLVLEKPLPDGDLPRAIEAAIGDRRLP